MANITENEALSILSVANMKEELRIPATETSHDGLLSRQIHDAANYAAKSTGVALADLHLLRPAIVSAVRQIYDGLHELSPNAAAYAWMEPYRARTSYKKAE